MVDKYLASGKLSDSEHFLFNILFELFNGCQFNCDGCHVNKNSAEPFSDEHHEQLISILKSFTKENFYSPFIAFIGPTDFLSASNAVQVLGDPRMVEVLRHFQRISLQTTYLSIANAPAIAEVMKKHYGDMELEINLVIEPTQVTNEKYLTTLADNQNKVHEIFNWDTKIRRFGIMNVFNYSETKVAELLANYDFLHKKVEQLFETTIDFNFSLGRKDSRLTNEEFYEAANRIKNMFNNSVVSDEKAQYLRFSFGRLSDSLIEKQYNWKNGEFYYSPLLYERYASFIPELKIPINEYNAKEFENFEEKVQMKQYMNLGDKEECGDCPLLGSCVDRGILYLMDIYDVKKCLVSKDAMHVVNAMGTLPYGSD